MNTGLLGELDSKSFWSVFNLTSLGFIRCLRYDAERYVKHFTHLYYTDSTNVKSILIGELIDRWVPEQRVIHQRKGHNGEWLTRGAY